MLGTKVGYIFPLHWLRYRVSIIQLFLLLNRARIKCIWGTITELFDSPHAAHGKVETRFVVVGEQEPPVSVQVSKTFEGMEREGQYQEYTVSNLFPSGNLQVQVYKASVRMGDKK